MVIPYWYNRYSGIFYARKVKFFRSKHHFQENRPFYVLSFYVIEIFHSTFFAWNNLPLITFLGHVQNSPNLSILDKDSISSRKFYSSLSIHFFHLVNHFLLRDTLRVSIKKFNSDQPLEDSQESRFFVTHFWSIAFRKSKTDKLFCNAKKFPTIQISQEGNGKTRYIPSLKKSQQKSAKRRERERERKKVMQWVIDLAVVRPLASPSARGALRSHAHT